MLYHETKLEAAEKRWRHDSQFLAHWKDVQSRCKTPSCSVMIEDNIQLYTARSEESWSTVLDLRGVTRRRYKGKTKNRMILEIMSYNYCPRSDRREERLGWLRDLRKGTFTDVVVEYKWNFGENNE